MKVLIAGATGLVGTALKHSFGKKGIDVTDLVRTAPNIGLPEVEWHPNQGEIDAAALEGFDAVINLAGESIAEGREAGRTQCLQEMTAPFLFFKRRRGNERQPDLIGFNLGLVLGNKAKRALNPGIRKCGFGSCAHYWTSKVTGSDSISGCVERLAMTLYLPGATTFRSLSR